MTSITVNGTVVNLSLDIGAANYIMAALYAQSRVHCHTTAGKYCKELAQQLEEKILEAVQNLDQQQKEERLKALGGDKPAGIVSEGSGW